MQLSKDGQVVVFHDDTLDRVCGVHARVDEKSFDELRLLRLCGTEQRIPLLTEVLEVVNGRGPLLVELKNGKRNRELCEKTYAILSDYRGEVCIESFNPMIVRWFKLHAKDLVRGQLATIREGLRRRGLAAHGLSAEPVPDELPVPAPVHRLSDRLPAPGGAPGEALGAMRFGWTPQRACRARPRRGDLRVLPSPVEDQVTEYEKPCRRIRSYESRRAVLTSPRLRRGDGSGVGSWGSARPE